MNKRTISLILGIVVLSLGVIFGVILVGQDQDFREKAAPATTITLNSSDPSPAVGEQFTISANVDSGENEVIAAELYFEFDPTKIEILDVVNGSFFLNPEVIGPTIDNSNGNVDYVTFILPGSDSVTGVGTLVNLSIRAKAPGTAVISLSPDSIVGATGENAQNVLVSSFPLSLDIQPSTAIGGGGFTSPTPTTQVTQAAATPMPTSVVTATIIPSPLPTTSFVTTVPTAATNLPETLPDTGIGDYAIWGVVVGAVLLLVSLAFAV